MPFNHHELVKLLEKHEAQRSGSEGGKSVNVTKCNVNKTSIHFCEPLRLSQNRKISSNNEDKKCHDPTILQNVTELVFCYSFDVRDP